MRRLPSSYNKHQISDAEIDDVIYGTIQPSVEIPLRPRDHGERVLYVGFSTARVGLVEIGVEEQDGELVVFHAREATKVAIQAFKEGR
jgi:hypothetical protein